MLLTVRHRLKCDCPLILLLMRAISSMQLLAAACGVRCKRRLVACIWSFISELYSAATESFHPFLLAAEVSQGAEGPSNARLAVFQRPSPSPLGSVAQTESGPGQVSRYARSKGDQLVKIHEACP